MYICIFVYLCIFLYIFVYLCIFLYIRTYLQKMRRAICDKNWKFSKSSKIAFPAPKNIGLSFVGQGHYGTDWLRRRIIVREDHLVWRVFSVTNIQRVEYSACGILSVRNIQCVEYSAWRSFSVTIIAPEDDCAGGWWRQSRISWNWTPTIGFDAELHN